MTYRTERPIAYRTELGCVVVTQIQETQAGVVIEHVALIGPREQEGNEGRAVIDIGERSRDRFGVEPAEA